MPQKSSKIRIDRCIYCSKDKINLRDEHVLPQAIGGRLVLGQAVCKKCEKETNTFEQRLLRETWGDARNLVGLRGSSKRRRRRDGKKSIAFDKFGRRVELEPQESDVALMFLTPNGKSHIETGHIPKSENKVPITLRFLNRTRRRQDIERFSTGNFREADFFRTLAKFGHGLATYHYGYGTFTPILTDYILSGDANYHRFIGSHKNSERSTKLHSWKFEELQFSETHSIWSGKRFILLRLHLFSLLSDVVYDIACGEI